MRLKNYQEDLVLHVIQIALEDRPDVRADEAFIHDVAAYTLNRIPPKYIHTERGFTRLACSDLSDTGDTEQLAGMVQVLLLVNRAVDIVQNRRDGGDRTEALPARQGGLPESSGSEDGGGAALGAMEYWHNLPYFLGQVVDARNEAPLYGVTVTAFVDGQPATSAEPGWQNPYRTLPATRGYYSFLPRPVRSTEEGLEFILRLDFEHPRYRPFQMERKVRTRGDFEIRTAIGSDDIVNLTATRLAPLN